MRPAADWTAPAAPSRWTVDDVVGVQWVIMRFLAMGSPPREVIQRRLHWADHMLPCLQNPGSMRGHGFDDIPDVGPLLALCSFITNCQRYPDDLEWCRAVLREAQVDVPELLATIEPLAHLYADPKDVPVALFQDDPNDYALVPLADLPFGHAMQECGHKKRFEAELRKIQRRARLLTLLGHRRNKGVEQVMAGRRLTRAVIRQDVSPCELHSNDLDWGLLNEQAERLRTTVRPWTQPNIQAAVERLDGLSTAERRMLEQLFIDPIRWDRGFNQVTGDRHRLCGYRGAGETRAFVAVGPRRSRKGGETGKPGRGTGKS